MDNGQVKIFVEFTTQRRLNDVMTLKIATPLFYNKTNCKVSREDAP